MIIKLNSIYKNKIIFKKKVYFCQVGKGGVVPKYSKKEGDKKTPCGKYKINKIFIKKKSILINKIKTFSKTQICNFDKNYIWCDDVSSHFYNKCVKKKSKQNLNFRFEELFRDDDVYDYFIELNYNRKPIIKGKGSAIFIHISFENLSPTNGCIALSKKNLKFLINNLQKNKLHIYKLINDYILENLCLIQ